MGVSLQSRGFGGGGEVDEARLDTIIRSSYSAVGFPRCSARSFAGLGGLDP